MDLLPVPLPTQFVTLACRLILAKLHCTSSRQLKIKINFVNMFNVYIIFYYLNYHRKVKLNLALLLVIYLFHHFLSFASSS